MDETPSERLHDGVRTPIVYLVFFVSGFAALVNQISWARQLGVVLGHTVDSAAVVLTSYFVGMAFGSLLGARIAGRVRPLRAYAISEFVAAGWTFIVPVALSRLPDGAQKLSATGVIDVLPARWLYCFVLLLPATVAIGATLPFIAEWFSRHSRYSGRQTVTAYAANTVGAFTGVVVAPMWLILNLGVCGSSYFAAGLCVVCGAVALSLQSRTPLPAEIPTPPIEPEGKVLLRSYITVSLSGFAILALEVLYTRMFALVLHNSTYTFGAVLAVVLAALSLGAGFARIGIRYFDVNRLIAWSMALGAVFTAFSVVIFARVTSFEYHTFDGGFSSYLTGVFGLVVLVVLPPMSAIGVVLPAVWGNRATTGANGGTFVGKTSVINSLAGGGGAALVGLVLLPTMGLWISFALIGCLLLLFAVLVFAAKGQWLSAGLCWIVFLIPTIPAVSPPGPERWSAQFDERVLRRWNSPYGWVDVVETEDHILKVRQNLHYRYGTTGSDAPRAYRQAHIPMLLHPQPREVLFLGLGTGLTAAGAIPHTDLERAVVVELIPEVVEAARFLSEANRGVVDHPKIEIRTDDARHYLMTTDRHFDVIVSDLFVPWESETGYLYTVEHFEAVRNRLRPGGVFCLWLALYQLGPRELEIIADSFAAVFPEASLWWGHLDSHRPIVALVGWEKPGAIDPAALDVRLARLWQETGIDVEIETSQKLLGRCIGRWQTMRHDQLNTDEHPRIEFLAPMSHIDKSLLQDGRMVRYFDDVFAALPMPRTSDAWPGSRDELRRIHRRALTGADREKPATGESR